MRSTILVFQSRQTVNRKCSQNIDLLFSGKSNQDNIPLENALRNAVIDLETKTGIDTRHFAIGQNK